MTQPPRLAEWVLALVLPRRQRAEVLGDLAENYYLRVRHFGLRAARLWYVKQAVSVPPWLWMEEGVAVMGLSVQEVRQVVRGMVRKPAFAAVTVITLALGIGANAAIFSVVDGVLLEPLPYANPDALVSIGHDAPGLDALGLTSATGLHVMYREMSHSFEEVSLYDAIRATLTGEGQAERILTSRVTPSLFTVLGVPTVVGRPFTEEEGHPEGPHAVVLSHGLWTERFGADPSVLGRTLVLNGVAREIVGVMPRSFAFPDAEIRLWTPLKIDPASMDFGGFNFGGLGRLADGATLASAERELNALIPTWGERFEFFTPALIEQAKLSVDVHPYVDDVVGNVRIALWIIMATVGLVLLIACANVANLMLVRAEGRTKEIAIRSAIGASRDRLLVRFMAESVVLATAGALLGVLLAHVSLKALIALGPQSMPRVGQIGIDGSVLVFVGAITVIATLAFGAISALGYRSNGEAGVLREGSRGSTGGRRSNRVRKLLVAAQVAFALILLVGSGLMLRSFDELRRVDPGFSGDGVMTFRVALPLADYPEVELAAAFHRGLLERLEAIPGVVAAGAISRLPLNGTGAMDPLFVEGSTRDPEGIPPLIETRAATPGYFEAMGIPLRQGRMTTMEDGEARSGAVLVSEGVVDQLFDGRNPLGRQVAFGIPGDMDPWSDVVGVVGDVHNASLTVEPMGAVYFPLLQREGVSKGWLTMSMSYALKTAVPPSSVLPSVRSLISEMDPNLPLSSVRTMEDIARAGRAQTGFTMLLLGIAAGVGLLMGSVGLYGVISYVTAQRTREIGVRMALGAEQADVRGMILRQGMAVTVVGLVVGLVGAFGLSRFMASMLFQVDATDPATYIVVAVVLLAVSTLATWIPARRAARTNPVDALRWE